MNDSYDPNLILAYVEDELDEAGRERFEQQCAADPGLRQLAERMRADKLALRALPTAKPSSTLSDTATDLMEREMLLGDAPLNDPSSFAAAGAVGATRTGESEARSMRLWRFVAYSGVAAAIAVAGVVVLQNLDGTPLLERAEQFATRDVEEGGGDKPDAVGAVADAVDVDADEPELVFGDAQREPAARYRDSAVVAGGELTVSSAEPPQAGATRGMANARMALDDGKIHAGESVLEEFGVSADRVLGFEASERFANEAEGGLAEADDAMHVFAMGEAAQRLAQEAPPGIDALVKPPDQGHVTVETPASTALADRPAPLDVPVQVTLNAADPQQAAQEVAAWVQQNGGLVFLASADPQRAQLGTPVGLVGRRGGFALDSSRAIERSETVVAASKLETDPAGELVEVVIPRQQLAPLVRAFDHRSDPPADAFADQRAKLGGVVPSVQSPTLSEPRPNAAPPPGLLWYRLPWASPVPAATQQADTPWPPADESVRVQLRIVPVKAVPSEQP